MNHRSIVLARVGVCIVAAMWFSAQGASAATIVTENFEGATQGSTLDQNGWSDLFGQPASTWTAAAPLGSGNTSSKVGEPTSGDSQITKAFGDAFTPPVGTTHFVVSAWMRDRKTGGNYQYMRMLVFTNLYYHATPTISIQGVDANHNSNDGKETAAFFVGGTQATNVLPVDEADDWFEMQFEITFNAGDPASSTGTLRVRDVTKGETGFTTVAGLENLTVDLTNAPPANWAHWKLRGGYLSQIDNLKVEALVPEPGSLALVGLGGLMLLRRKRRRQM